MSRAKLPDPPLVPRPKTATPTCPSCYLSDPEESWTCGACDAPFASFVGETACSECKVDMDEVQCRPCEAWSPREEWTQGHDPRKVWAARAVGVIAALMLSPLAIIPMVRTGDRELLEVACALLLYIAGGAFFVAANVVRATLDGNLGHRRRGRGGITYWAPVLLAGLLPYAAILHGWGWVSLVLVALPFVLQYYALRQLGRETCPPDVFLARQARARSATFAPGSAASGVAKRPGSTTRVVERLAYRSHAPLRAGGSNPQAVSRGLSRDV
ncbi:MAG: hypothetical protein JKY65_14650 [Planctomycetes bacterium]|nr:hypothetical protein [Planctomycetota bacterium]